MIKTILALIFSIFSIIAFAQTSEIKISVLDAENDESLIGATVYFEEVRKGAVTNLDGIASFTEIPSGSHQIRIS